MLVLEVRISQGSNFWSDVVKKLVHKLYEAGYPVLVSVKYRRHVILI